MSDYLETLLLFKQAASWRVRASLWTNGFMIEDVFRDLVLGRRRGPGAWIARWLLRLLSFPYSVVVRARNRAYDLGWIQQYHARIPVVSVGNLTVGGTGKTPVVESIAEWYRHNGIRVAILSRGYGARTGPNDEARVLQANLPEVPHLQGRRRKALAQRAIDEFGSELILLDDGMQHRQLARNLEIVLIDATCPFGGGWPLPGGLLREPLSSLRRAHLIAITRGDLVESNDRRQIVEQIRRYALRPPIVEIDFRPSELVGANGVAMGPSALEGRRVLAFCGIGNPASFRITLETMGASLVDLMVFPDHHVYTPTETTDLLEWARRVRADCLVTTQKDWVKVVDLVGQDCEEQRPLLFLRIRAVVTAGGADFQRALASAHPRLAPIAAPGSFVVDESP